MNYYYDIMNCVRETFNIQNTGIKLRIVVALWQPHLLKHHLALRQVP